ncbi:hypothetical protein [Campylobacter sp.]|uniref:hypothetical protein n=1 Tax=Campylobacter sp. TaxID=205 RepID=UPI002701F7C1|nr:hypothetical protein [Campylobacter sp.]
MRVVLTFLVAVLLSFGYEINHENWGKFYKFIGMADEEKFELYLNSFDNEFENFKGEKGFELPSKIYGHLFFKGEKFEFSKGKIEKTDSNITAINALSDWLNLDVKLDEEGKLSGKLAIKGKAHKAKITKNMSYEILALGLQIIKTGDVRLEAIASDFFSVDFTTKNKNNLKEKLRNFKQEFKDSEQNLFKNDILTLEFNNEIFKTTCRNFGKDGKICSSKFLKNGKDISLKDIFINLDDEKLKATFESKDIKTDGNFALTPAGISFQNEGEQKGVSLEEIKPFMKDSFGLF